MRCCNSEETGPEDAVADGDAVFDCAEQPTQANRKTNTNLFIRKNQKPLAENILKFDYLTRAVSNPGDPGLCQLARRKDLERKDVVHGAGAEALEVEGDVLEAERLEDAGEFGRHLQAHGTL